MLSPTSACQAAPPMPCRARPSRRARASRGSAPTRPGASMQPAMACRRSVSSGAVAVREAAPAAAPAARCRHGEPCKGVCDGLTYISYRLRLRNAAAAVAPAS